VRSIAFPAISTGAYRFPKERAAAIAVTRVGGWIAVGDRLERVLFCCSGEPDAAIYRTALAHPARG
jgi:O-acetyl-ADP-ribose deacetylase (regulator of RNase III)